MCVMERVGKRPGDGDMTWGGGLVAALHRPQGVGMLGEGASEKGGKEEGKGEALKPPPYIIDCS